MVLRPPSKDALNPATPGKSKFGLKLERDHHASDIEFGVKASIGLSVAARRRAFSAWRALGGTPLYRSAQIPI